MRTINVSLVRLVIFGFCILLVSNLFSTLAASNQIQTTRLQYQSIPITMNDFLPAECKSLTLVAVVTGSGDIRGTGRSELIIGSPGPDTITALNGNDCVLGGEGDDVIYGGNGDDVLLGGPGADTLSGDFGTDYCFSGVVTNDCEYSFP